MRKLIRLFLLDPLKDSNMTVLMDYYWEFNSDMLKMMDFRYQYCWSNLDLLMVLYLSSKQVIIIDTDKINLGISVNTWLDMMI